MNNLRTIVIILISLALGVGAYSLSQQVQNNQSTDDSSAQVNATNPNLQYFGYFDVDKGEQINYFDFVGDLENANVAHMHATLDQVAMNELLDNANRNGFQSIINVEWIFLANRNAGGNGDGSAQLLPDWKARWETFNNIISPRKNEIYAFYFDEPFWVGISQVDFRAITKEIQDSQSNVKVMAIEAFPPLQNDLVSKEYIEFVDDYGFDYYFSFLNETEQSFVDLYNKLIFLAPQNKIWLVPEGFATSYENTTEVTQLLEFYTNFANERDEVIGLLVFTLTDFDENIGLYSLMNANSSQSENLLNSNIEIGKTITNNQLNIQTNNCVAIDYNNDNFVNISDFANFAKYYNSNCTWVQIVGSCGSIDSNADNSITIIDLANFALQYGNTCN